MTDLLAEMTHGKKGAVTVFGKIVLGKRHRTSSDLVKTLIAGVVFSNVELPIDEEWEMWECEITIIPKRKYGMHKENRGGFRGMRIDQILTSPFAEPENWGDEYFKSKA